MQPIRLKLLPRAASATLLALSQAVAGALPLVLTATAAGPIDPQVSVSGPLSRGLGRIVSITSAGNDNGLSAIIVGKDQNGMTTTETIAALGSSSAVVSVNYYTSISSITLSGAAATTIEAGVVNTTASAALATIPLNFYSRIGSQVSVDVVNTISYTVQMTFDDCLGQSASSNIFQATPASPTALTAQSTSKYTQLPVGVCGLAITIPTFTTTGAISVNIVTPSNSNAG